MLRNVVLFLISAAVLAALFIGYTRFARVPDIKDRGADAGTTTRPAESSRAADGTPSATDPAAPRLPRQVNIDEEKKASIEVEGKTLELPPGEKMRYIHYDSMGRPTDSFRCDNWEKVPGTENEIRVYAPEMMLRLPSGMIVTIAANAGQVRADPGQKDRLRPKAGWLEGNATITVDRATTDERTPLRERPEDRVTIEMSRLDFDIELGSVRTDGALHVESREFDLNGRGLEMVWNQAANRIDRMVIAEGGSLELRGETMQMLERGKPQALARAGDAETAAPNAPAHKPVRPDRPRDAYTCDFHDRVIVTQWVGDEQAGVLRGDMLALLFDLRGAELRGPDKTKDDPGDGATGAEPDAPATHAAEDLATATTQPIAAPPKRLVVQWDGPLNVAPAAAPEPGTPARRRIEAIGSPLIVESSNETVRAGRLVFHDEEKRLWLYPLENERVEITSDKGVDVRAENFFVDLKANLVKLVGNVHFETGSSAQHTLDPMTIRCDHWAELHLTDRRAAPAPGDAFESPIASSRPKSAVFSGNVRVAYEDQLVRSNRFEVTFREPTAPETNQPPATADADTASPPKLQAMLKSAHASGDVHVTATDWQHTSAVDARVEPQPGRCAHVGVARLLEAGPRARERRRRRQRPVDSLRQSANGFRSAQRRRLPTLAPGRGRRPHL